MRIYAILAVLALPTIVSAQLVPSNNDEGQRAAARRAAVQSAQGQVDAAEATLTAVNARIQANWKASPDVLAATRDMEIKQATFDKARLPVIEKLKADPDYQAALSQAMQADTVVKQEQADASRAAPTTQSAVAAPTTLPAPSASQVAAASDKLEQKSALHDMEAKAIAADPNALQAQSDLDAAREKVKVLQLQFDAAKLNDPDYKAALAQLNNAKSQLTAAAGQY